MFAGAHQQEVVVLSSVATAYRREHTCECCDLPYNDLPIVIGLPLALSVGVGDTSDAHLRRGYDFFVAYANEVKLGLCIGGERRPIQAVYMGSADTQEAATNATLYLSSHHGVDLFLGPAADFINREVAENTNNTQALLLAGLASDPEIFGLPWSHPVLGLMSDPQKRLRTVLVELWQRGATTVVTLHAETPTTVSMAISDAYTKLARMCSLPGSDLPPRMTVQRDEFVTQPVSVAKYREALLNLPPANILIACLPYDECVRLVQAAIDVDANFDALVLPDCMLSEEFANAVGHAAQFILGSALWAKELTPTSDFSSLTAEDFVTLYKRNLGEWPTAEVAIAFSIGSTLALAMQDANSTSPADVANSIRANSWNTFYGPVNFASNPSSRQLNLSDKVFQRVGTDVLEFVGSPSNTLQTTASLVYPKPAWADHWCYMELESIQVSGQTFNAIWGIDSDSDWPIYNKTHDPEYYEGALPPAGAAAATHYAAYVIGLPDNEQVSAANAAFEEATSLSIAASTHWSSVAAAMRGISNLVFSTQDKWYQAIAAEAAVARLRVWPNSSTVCTPCPIRKIANRAQPSPNSTTCEICPAGFAAFTVFADSEGELGPDLVGVNRACISACNAGESLNHSTSTCTPCPAGEFGDDGLSCQPCPAGFFTGIPNMQSCLPCTQGTFGTQSGSSECFECAAGQEVLIGPWGEGIGCRDCSPGTFAPNPRTQRCELCALGKTATEYGETACTDCTPGKYSNWNATQCEPCEVGKYQPKSGQGVCEEGVITADFEERGLIRGHNRDGVWVREEPGEAIEWERCNDIPGSCHQEERCGVGSTGLHCNACLPGYVHTSLMDAPTACFQCFPLWWNISAAAVGFMIFLGFAVLLTNQAAKAVRKPQALQVVLLKIFVQYTVFTNIIGFIVGSIVVTRRHLLGSITVRVFSIGVAPLNMMGNMWFMVSDTPVISIRCLAQFFVDDSKVPIEELREATHAKWFDPALEEGWQEFQAYQKSVETLAALFWFAFPVVAFVALLVLSYLYVSWSFWRQRHFYRKAAGFYDMMFREGSAVVTQHYEKSEEWIVFVREYHYKLLGIWWPVAHFQIAQAEAQPSCWSQIFLVNWKTFLREAKPVILSIIVVGHGGVIFGFVSCMRCKTYGDEVRRIAMANMVVCPDAGDTLFWIAQVGTVVWGTLAPIVLLVGVHKQKEDILTDDRTKVEFSIIFNGYRHECWGWELLAFLTETLLIATIQLEFSPESMNKIVLAMGLTYGAVHLACHPYDDRCEGLLTQVHNFFTATWILTCIIVEFVLGVDSLDNDQAGLSAADKTEAWVTGILCLLALSILHGSFFGFLWFRVYTRSLDSHMAKVYSHVGPGHEKFEHDLEVLAEQGGMRARIKEMMIKQYRKHLQSAGYVCFDPLFGWSVLCGSRGDHRVSPVIPRGRGFLTTGGRPLLSNCPKGPVDPVTRPAKLAQKEALGRALTSCAEEIARKLNTPTFSASLLEFVLRASFVLARSKEHHLNLEEEIFEHRDAGGAEMDVLQAVGQTATEFTATHKRLQADGAGFLQFEPTGSCIVPKFASLHPNDVNHVKKGWMRALHHLEEEMWVGRKYWRRNKHEQGHLATTMSYSSAASAESLASALPSAAHTSSSRIFGQVRSMLGGSTPDGTSQPDIGARTISGISRFISTGPSVDFIPYPGQAMNAQKSNTVMRQRLIRRTKQMFGASTFRRGVELEKLQVALMEVQSCASQELRQWVDLFEERWVRHNEFVAHKLDQYTGLVQDQQLQCEIKRPEEQDDAGGSMPVGRLSSWGVEAEDTDNSETDRIREQALAEALMTYETDVLGSKDGKDADAKQIDFEVTYADAEVQTTTNVALPHYHLIHGHNSKASAHVVLKGAKAFSDATRMRWVRLVLRAGKFDRPLLRALPIGLVKLLLLKRRSKQGVALELKLKKEIDELAAEQVSLQKLEAELQQLRDAGHVPKDGSSDSEVSRSRFSSGSSFRLQAPAMLNPVAEETAPSRENTTI